MTYEQWCTYWPWFLGITIAIYVLFTGVVNNGMDCTKTWTGYDE